MVEDVQTGGIMQFKYKGNNVKLDDERKSAIEEGYKQAEERKRIERKRKKIRWFGIVLVILVMLIGLYFIFNAR
ncbi:hypothetical protein COU54_05265 [Candidatus Pacearchaeota archaeon CG10_big_fil_rev_8_21_14_0_10_31_24]|nr:MAG: hypothetical protein COU54_05265 [Candidatus Pacearchaeota archaeon CG10_big_fil_rev_8_21_14_0_10_31_24]